MKKWINKSAGIPAWTENQKHIGVFGDRAVVETMIVVDGKDDNGLFRRFFLTNGILLGEVRKPLDSQLA